MNISNQTLENGHKLIIKTKIPIMGISLLKNYVDETLGEMGQSEFAKKFRYSKDGGASFSGWADLTDSNLSKVDIDVAEWYIFEYEYTHVGVRNPMYFSSSRMSIRVETSDKDEIYKKTDFSKFFDIDDPDVLAWAYNVLEKLYEKGILPKYYSRNNVKDFQDYWLTVTHFFALIVKLGRLPENIPDNKILFEQFLDVRGLFFSGEEDKEQREYLFRNYIMEYGKRGTYEIFTKDGKNLGEFLRLINYKEIDELIYTALYNDEMGWCLGSSSPMWDQAILLHSLFKGYEYGEDVVDVTRYPVNPGTEIVEYNERKYLKLTADNFLGNRISQFSKANVIEYGNGSLKNIDGRQTVLFKISPDMDYEISFRIAQKSTSDIEFGVVPLNRNFQQTQLKDSRNGVDSNIFGTFSVEAKENGECVYTACILNSNTEHNAKMCVNVPNGNNLINKGETVYIMPQIKILHDSESLIRDIKIKPLNLPSSQGQMGQKEIFLPYFNNNSLRSDDEVKEITERFLLPYKLKIWSNLKIVDK